MKHTVADARFASASGAVASHGGPGGFSTPGSAMSRAAEAWNDPRAVAERKAEWARLANILPKGDTEGALADVLRHALGKATAPAVETPTAGTLAVPKAANVYDLAKHQDVAGYIKARQKQSARAA